MTDVSVAIMAGGKSSRMGTDKAFVTLQGRTLIAHLLERVAGIGQRETFLVANHPADYAHLGLPMFTDVLPGKGSLGGIYTAIQVSQSAYTLVLAVDMPLVRPALLRYMVSLCEGDAHDVIVPRVGGHLEGLHAIYGRRCLDPIRQQLDADRLKVIGFYDAVRVRLVDEPEHRRFDPDGGSFFNVNTPADLAEAARLVGMEPR
jgi:molybdopterin-guanine dinucleotide biosynthesis protein A